MRQEELDAIRKRDAFFCGFQACDLDQAEQDRRALLAEIDRLRAAMTLRPIATAPCDTEILLAERTWFGAAWSFMGGMVPQSRAITASHWSPLPRLPDAGQ